VDGQAGPDMELVLLLLLVVALVAAVVRVVRLPYTVALVVAGLALALAPWTPHVELTPELILLGFLPVLLFEATFRLDATQLRPNLRPITLLAVPGVLLTALLIAAALWGVAGLRWETALLFGAIVAATDPVAVLAIFAQVGTPRRLAIIMEGESLFNDGTALVLFRVLVAAVVTGRFDPASAALGFVLVAAGGLLVGIGIGLLAARLLIPIDDALLETTVTLIVAYGSYLLAEQLGVSGVLAVVAAGLLVGAQAHRVLLPATRASVEFVWEFLGFLANSLLFLLVGLQLHTAAAALGTSGGVGLVAALLVAILALVGVRALVVALSTALLNRIDRPLPWRRNWVLTWGAAAVRSPSPWSSRCRRPARMAPRFPIESCSSC
jgi:Na+/H+ antiporter